MNYKLSCLLLLGLLALVLNEVQGVDEDAKWVEIFHKIYDTNPETATLTPEETLDLLNELEVELAKDDSTKETDNMVLAFDRIKTLISVSKIEESKCTGSVFEDLKEVIMAHEFVYWNVAKYLQHYQSVQFSKCKPALDSQIVKADEKFSTPEREQVEMLVKDVQQYSQGQIDGLKVYMERKFGSMSAFRNEREKFINAYEESAEKMCHKVMDELREPMSIYKHVIEQEEVVAQMDKLSSDWVNNARVCEYLLSTMDELKRSSSRALVSLINKPMRLG